MKRLVYIKPVKHVQIGHLYEHLYAHQLVRAFRSKGLFAYLDYSIDARTYYDGYVYLEVHLYNERALQYEQLITDFRVRLNSDTINGGLLQIMAEKYADVRFIDDDILLKTLEHYDALPWQPLSSIAMKSFKGERKTHRGLELSERSHRQFLTLTQRISFDYTATSLDEYAAKALFVVVANMLRENLQEDIADSSFCYSVSDTFTKRGTVLFDTNTYRIDKRQATEVTSEPRIARALLKSMNEHDVAERLADFLGRASIEKHLSMPHEQEVIEKVGVVIGPTGWHKLGTAAAVQELLDKCHVEFSIGRKR